MNNKIIAVFTVLLAAFVICQAANAAQQVGNGCWVHAWPPVALNARIGFEGYPQGHGRIDGCTDQDANYDMSLQTCIQVGNGSGGWATKQETCLYSSGHVAAIDEKPVAYSFASPRVYRTWAYGCSGGVCKVMTSAGANW